MGALFEMCCGMWNSFGGVGGELWKACGKAVGELWESCGRAVVGGKGAGRKRAGREPAGKERAVGELWWAERERERSGREGSLRVSCRRIVGKLWESCAGTVGEL